MSELLKALNNIDFSGMSIGDKAIILAVNEQFIQMQERSENAEGYAQSLNQLLEARDFELSRLERQLAEMDGRRLVNLHALNQHKEQLAELAKQKAAAFVVSPGKAKLFFHGQGLPVDTKLFTRAAPATVLTFVGEVDTSDLDRDSKDFEDIRNIAECDGWNAAVRESEYLSLHSGVTLNPASDSCPAEIETLKLVSDIAHFGALCSLSLGGTINEIRKATLPYFNRDFNAEMIEDLKERMNQGRKGKTPVTELNIPVECAHQWVVNSELGRPDWDMCCKCGKHKREEK